VSKEETKTVKVKLLKDHQHGKMRHSTGMEIEVPELDAKWLINLKVAEEVKTSAATTQKPTEDK
jgi:hypothetical protein